MLYQGAEAKIIRSTYLGKPVVRKHRIKKTYRIKEIDEVLIGSRTREEAKLLHLARQAGVFVPFVYDIDIVQGVLTMSYVKGSRIKDIFDDLNQETRKRLCLLIGEQIARLHNHDLIHGDLTTSNMILSDNHVYFMYFGLGEINHEIEAKGVDLHVLMEALESTHSQHADDFTIILKGYKTRYQGDGSHIEKKIKDIVKRGRYR
jgi:TP53 regulating kinase-like protein